MTTAGRPVAHSLPTPLVIFRTLSLTLLLSTAALYEAVHLSALSNGDVWLHLRTGLWILQNHAVPRTGLFSQYPDLPWNASSWGYEVVLALAYKLVGLRAIPILLMGLKVALAAVTFLLARIGRTNFWTAVVLSAIAQYVLSDLHALPSVLSILFFGIELLVLLHTRRSGTLRYLFWLPLLFVLWANLHLQFVMGLLLLGLFLVALFLERWARALRVNWISDRIRPLPIAKVGAIAGLSLLGTFLTPYSFHLLPAVLKTLYSDVSLHYFAEMHAMSFRRPQEFVLMLLVMAAFFALGRKRSLQAFELIALLAATVLAFRIPRDAWIAVLAAVGVLSEGFQWQGSQPEPQSSLPVRWEQPVAAVLAIMIFIPAAIRLPNQSAIMNRVSQVFPVKACDFLRETHLPEPLFNAYPWGGFLTWYMPQYPVAVDGRVELYGDEILTRYFKVMGGDERLDVDPKVAGAHTLLLERQSGMTKALTNLPALSSQYRVVYSDNLAAVFVRQ